MVGSVFHVVYLRGCLVLMFDFDYRLVGWSVGRSFGRSVGRPVGWAGDGHSTFFNPVYCVRLTIPFSILRFPAASAFFPSVGLSIVFGRSLGRSVGTFVRPS